MTLSRKLATLIVSKEIPIAEVVSLLSKYKMLGLLPALKKALEDLSNRSETRNTIMIESPFALSLESIQKIKRIVGNDLAQHDVIINKNLLAGFKARYKEILYDGSAERALKTFIKNNH